MFHISDTKSEILALVKNGLTPFFFLNASFCLGVSNFRENSRSVSIFLFDLAVSGSRSLCEAPWGLYFLEGYLSELRSSDVLTGS